MNLKRRRERGAIVVDASISLTTFVFALYILISLVDIAFVQYKMAVALNSAAKEISQYVYLYYKFGLDEYNEELSDAAAESHSTASNTLTSLGQMVDAFSNAGESMEGGEFQTAYDELVKGKNIATDEAKVLKEKIQADPKGFISGMGMLAASELVEEGKTLLGQVLAQALMEKNLRNAESQNAESFLRVSRVKDGTDGLDFQYTTLMAYGKTNEINLVCTYQVTVVELLKKDFNFTFRQMAKSLAWGNGVSILNPPNIWETMGYGPRGEYIVEQEKKEFEYTAEKMSFDAYSNTGGKNEFVSIVSMDPSLKTYQTEQGIKKKISNELNAMYQVVPKLDNPFTVLDSDGNEVQVMSPPETRTYHIVIVIPEGVSDDYLDLVNETIESAKSTYYDTPFEVTVKQGYGTLPEQEKKDETEGK